jgi:hypothetical protein
LGSPKTTAAWNLSQAKLNWHLQDFKGGICRPYFLPAAKYAFAHKLCDFVALSLRDVEKGLAK